MKVKRRSPRLTRLEKLTKGLSSDPNKYKSKFSVCEVEDKGRSLFLLKGIIKKDSFVLEYEGDLISHREAERREAAYALNKEGCYILFFKFQRRKVAIDATRHFSSYARYLNHSRQPNIKFHTPLIVDLDCKNVPRIGAYALKDIHEGDEIVFDYGVRDSGISWLKNTKISHMTKLSSNQSDSESSSEDESMSDYSGNLFQKPGISHRQSVEWSSRSQSSKVSQCLNRSAIMVSSMQLSLLTGDYALRFTPKPTHHAARPSYSVRFENLDEPEKILRIIENQKRPPSVITLSESESHSESDDVLPSNKEPNSISKVMEWQCQNPFIFNDVHSDIKILNVESMGVSASRPSSSVSTPLSTIGKMASSCQQVSNDICGNVVPKQHMSSMEDSWCDEGKSNPYNICNSNIPNTFQKTKSQTSFSRPSTSHHCYQSHQENQLSKPVSVTPYGLLRENKRQATTDLPVVEEKSRPSDECDDMPVMSDYFGTWVRLKAKGCDMENEPLVGLNGPDILHSVSNSAVEDEDLIFIDSPAPSKVSSPKNSNAKDIDYVEVISLSSDDLGETIKNLLPSEDEDFDRCAQTSYPIASAELNKFSQVQNSFQLPKTGVEEHFRKGMNQSSPIPGPSGSSAVVNPSKRGVDSIVHDMFSSTSSLEIVVEDDSSTDAKPLHQTFKASASTSFPEIIAEHDSGTDGVNHSGPSFTLSTSTALSSHQGPSLIRQSLASPPVAVIKPFNACDGLDINEEETIRLREILCPHLFSNNALSQDIQTAILKNWAFFKTLTDRGVTLDDIRASVRRFMKAAEKERRRSNQQKGSVPPHNSRENHKIS